MASIPDSAYCGDTVEWSQTVEASGMTGKAILRHIETGETITLTPSVSGNVWSFTMHPEESIEKPSGLYIVALITELSGSRETVSGGKITLMEPIDRPQRESHARRMVKILEAHIEGRMHEEEGRGLESYTVGGVPISKISIPEARELLRRYRIDVQQEIAQSRVEAGLGGGSRILTQFE